MALRLEAQFRVVGGKEESTSCRRESAWNLPVDIDYQTYPARKPLKGDSESVERVFLAMLTCCSPFGGYY